MSWYTTVKIFVILFPWFLTSNSLWKNITPAAVQIIYVVFIYKVFTSTELFLLSSNYQSTSPQISQCSCCYLQDKIISLLVYIYLVYVFLAMFNYTHSLNFEKQQSSKKKLTVEWVHPYIVWFIIFNSLWKTNSLAVFQNIKAIFICKCNMINIRFSAWFQGVKSKNNFFYKLNPMGTIGAMYSKYLPPPPTFYIKR